MLTFLSANDIGVWPANAPVDAALHKVTAADAQ